MSKRDTLIKEYEDEYEEEVPLSEGSMQDINSEEEVEVEREKERERVVKKRIVKVVNLENS